jgi:hypothetical protein
MTFSKCPRCKKYSLKEVNESEVIGVTQCVKGNKAIMNRRQYGVKCLLCNYNITKTMIVDSNGHRIA